MRILHHQKQRSIEGRHHNGLHHSFHRCMCSGVHIQVHLIAIHSFGIILDFVYTTINIMLVIHQGVTIGRHGQIRVSVIRHVVQKAEISVLYML